MPIRPTRVHFAGWLVLLVALLPLVGTPTAVGQEKEPVYVGVRVCSECHQGAESGHQFSLWRLSKHAKAHATLSLPVSEEIARRSGIPEAPLEARVCLGCHTTGADAEEWRRDETFLIEDGVQCETCHGPGSEYIDVEVMRNRELAMERGLVMPERQSCMVCHGPKGSHEVVLEPSPWEYESAREAIAHPKPARPAADPSGSGLGRSLDESTHRFAGVIACAGCHAGAEMGFQFSKWRMGPHAGAYARLATPLAREMAAAAGVVGDPQTSGECLRCHVTGAGFGAESFAPGFDIGDGVQCESCHGPGADYLPEAVMLDPAAARHAGLQEPSAQICAGCHERAHGRPFEVETAMSEIAHPNELVQVGANDEPEYKTPINLTLTPDGRELWIACEASSSTIVVDTRTRTKVAEIPVGGQPHDVAFSPDGRRAYVTNRLDDSLSVIDVASREVVRTIAVGDEPHGVITDGSGR
ncbi:MAG: multiheme c-type cytochrome, partial [Thermoanaerobaculia bacterium]